MTVPLSSLQHPSNSTLFHNITFLHSCLISLLITLSCLLNLICLVLSCLDFLNSHCRALSPLYKETNLFQVNLFRETIIHSGFSSINHYLSNYHLLSLLLSIRRLVSSQCLESSVLSLSFQLMNYHLTYFNSAVYIQVYILPCLDLWISQIHTAIIACCLTSLSVPITRNFYSQVEIV